MWRHAGGERDAPGLRAWRCRAQGRGQTGRLKPGMSSRGEWPNGTRQASARDAGEWLIISLRAHFDSLVATVVTLRPVLIPGLHAIQLIVTKPHRQLVAPSNAFAGPLGAQATLAGRVALALQIVERGAGAPERCAVVHRQVKGWGWGARQAAASRCILGSRGGCGGSRNSATRQRPRLSALRALGRGTGNGELAVAEQPRCLPLLATKKGLPAGPGGDSGCAPGPPAECAKRLVAAATLLPLHPQHSLRRTWTAQAANSASRASAPAPFTGRGAILHGAAADEQLALQQ